MQTQSIDIDTVPLAIITHHKYETNVWFRSPIVLTLRHQIMRPLTKIMYTINHQPIHKQQWLSTRAR